MSSECAAEENASPRNEREPSPLSHAFATMACVLAASPASTALPLTRARRGGRASPASRAPPRSARASRRGLGCAPSPPPPALRVVAAAAAAAASDDSATASGDDFDLDADDLQFMDGEFVVEAFDDPAQLAKALVLEVEENAKACIAERGAFVLAIPGGSVAKALAGLADVEGVDWAKVHLFYVNERVPGGKCHALAKATWVDALGGALPVENVHAVDESSESLEEAARAYEAQMRDLPRDVLPLDEVNGLPVFDLILLGMGADGHVGSVYPGSAAVTEAAELSEGVLAVEMPEKRSVTMSLRLINTAERVVVAASGAEKAETVRKALEDDECELPGALVDAFSTVWFLDLAAAGELEAYQEVGEDDDE